MKVSNMSREYLSLKKIEGPLVVVEGVEGVSYNEIVEIKLKDGLKHGKVVQIQDDVAVVQVFENTSGMTVDDVSVKFTGRPLEIKLSREILGRTFNGIGEAIDGGGPIFTGIKLDVNGSPINPVARRYPRNYIQTGISAIDTLTTLIRGQKLPIFSGNGLPHNKIVAQIVKQAKIAEGEGEFAVVLPQWE